MLLAQEFPHSAALADFDLDGRLDVFCTNGFITGETPADT
jgi:hypothetical protein